MDLLQQIADCGYPDEFLATRLLGKKGTLFRSWEFLITRPNTLEKLAGTPFYPYLKKSGTQGSWRFLRLEHLWVYRKMNSALRYQFSSYFVYHEITTLLVCLRHLTGREESREISLELQHSLLHKDIKNILAAGLEPGAALQRLEARLQQCSDHFRGLARSYETDSIYGVEHFLRDSCFAYLLSRKQPRQLQTLLRHLADFHNVLALAKILRWQIKAEPQPIPGGTVPSTVWQKAYCRKDLTPVLRFLRLPESAATGIGISKLENLLLHFITLGLKRASLQRSIVGTILFYLWEQYRYVRNISMILSTTLLDDEPVMAGIIT